MDACVEHLGRLPSQLNLSNDQIRELLTYHRIKSKSQRVCRECLDKDQTREKTCFVCERTFTDKQGVIGGRGGKPDDSFLSMMKGWSQVSEMKNNPERFVTRDNFDEKKDDLERAWREQCKARGIEILD